MFPLHILPISPALLLVFFSSLNLCIRVHAVSSESVTSWAKELSSNLLGLFEGATKADEVLKAYRGVAEAETFDVRAELKSIKRQVELYFRERTKMAWDAKVSLESRELGNVSEHDVNDPLSKGFVQYLSAKRMTDAAIVYLDGHFGGMVEVNSTKDYELRSNVNFYGIPTSSDASAVHVPTPVYNRNPYMLRRVEWSEIDQLYRRNRERLKDLSFQKFCSESGFMRYFPAAPWIWDNKDTELDMFDCRSTEWFIDAATMSKNVLILLDLSGSMLGQRLEIAKQTIESILDTFSDNDFFNIMAFSKNTNFLDECTEEGLLQATMRNKKLLWSRLLNISSEGKAEYEKALSKAFTTLMDIKRFTGNIQMGCNDVIILITDGAPSHFKEVFDFYNKEKRIRFFSFLVGEEATDFEQVRWMACNNRGFMAHINNLADVQEKVQHYVKVMTRPISRQSASIHQDNAIWSGTARERMSNEFVISVSYPVVLDGTFMGVSAVSVPLVELAQIEHPSMIGARSYFFMLDNNGYAMFHPQLRPIDPMTWEVKATFNNMDFDEVDIQTLHSSRVVLNCNGNEPKSLETHFAVERLRRIYPQKNNYYAECVDGTHFILGLGIAEGDNVRLKRARPPDLTSIDMAWFKDHNWRLHPRWRYCLLNDSDAHMTPETAFTSYAKQMRDSGEMPHLCRVRRRLIDRLLLDLQATSTLGNIWTSDSAKNKENGVHLTFLSTGSGLIRYMNQSLDDLLYEHPEGLAENSTEFAYKHFVLELSRRSTEEEYFKRAVRQKGKVVFDINRQTRIWQNNEETAYGNAENETLLGLAYKAMYVDDALVGVVGMEFLYDKLAEKMKKLGCNPNDDRTRCFLLDEHAYVVYTSQKDTIYSDFIKANPPEHSQQTTNQTSRRRRGPNRQQQQQQRLKAAEAKLPVVVLGSFFGHVNRVTEWTMEILLKKGFYTETQFIDNQAMCEPEPILFTTAAASSIIRPFVSMLSHLVISGLNLFSSLFILPEFVYSSPPPPPTVGPSTFKPVSGRYPCKMASKFYLANTNRKGSPSSALLEENYSERPCKHNAAQCSIKVYAHWVEGTNLLLVVVKQGSRSQCYDGTHCAMSVPPSVPFGFQKIDYSTPQDESSFSAEETDEGGSVAARGATETTMNSESIACLTKSATKRKNMVQCLRDDFLEDESDLPCSDAVVGRRIPTLALALFPLLLRFLR